LSARGYVTVTIGKVYDIFAGKGITKSIPAKNNAENIHRTILAVREMLPGLLFTNLVDFDTLYGHRNDPQGFAQALEEFDAALPELMAAVAPDGALFITADHGCDPTTSSTDHSREFVPLLVWGPRLRKGAFLGVRATFADIAATIAEFFGFTWEMGESFASLLWQNGP